MDLKVEVKGLDKFKDFLNTDTWYKTQKRTTTRAGSRFRKTVVKDVRETYNIKAKELKKYMRSNLIKIDGSYAWKMNVKSRRLSLSHFNPKQTKKGVSVLIRKDEGRKVLSRTFIAKNNQVFQRVGKERLPLEIKRTISVPQMFNEQIVKAALKDIEEFYPKEFEHNLNYYLGKIK